MVIPSSGCIFSISHFPSTREPRRFLHRGCSRLLSSLCASLGLAASLRLVGVAARGPIRVPIRVVGLFVGPRAAICFLLASRLPSRYDAIDLNHEYDKHHEPKCNTYIPGALGTN
jgi:hypothetical protein